MIDPLEIPPLGVCDLAEVKRFYGRRLTLKGNLRAMMSTTHTDGKYLSGEHPL